MKIIADENIAYGREAFECFGDVTLLHGRKITRQDVADADILVIRSVTKANAALLEGSNVRFVGTATIGIDHIDKAWLDQNKIVWSSAKGCNSRAVTEYVVSAIIDITKDTNLKLEGKTIAVVGAGNIGSRIVKIGNDLGLKVIVNDPPLERQSARPDFNYVTLEEALKADIITLHVPLTKEGPDKTVHLLNQDNLNLINPGTLLINCSRGAVIDNHALSEFLAGRKDISVCLDVWESEPQIDPALIGLVKIATPHIAGYSLEGKAAGTKMIHDALANYLGVPSSWTPELPPLLEPGLLANGNAPFEKAIHYAVSKVYFIHEDDILMRRMTALPENSRKEYFDNLRKYYTPRREFSNFCVSVKPWNERLANAFATLGFKVNETPK